MAMTVKDLLDRLVGVPHDLLVVMASDAEGNSHSPLEGATDHYHYEADSTWSGSIRDPEDSEDQEDADHLETLPKVFLLWPVN